MMDLPEVCVPVPANLPRKGNWIDNGPVSNMTRGEAVVTFRSVKTLFIEPAYVAAKAPDVLVPCASGDGMQPFHERVAAADPRRVKALGKPKSRGGLVDARPDWEQVCIGAMMSFLAQKFVPGTAEARWLVESEPASLVEFSNWGDRRWAVAFRDGDQVARGRNALCLLLRIGRNRLLQGRPFPIAEESEWSSFQALLVPAMLRLAPLDFGIQAGAMRKPGSADDGWGEFSARIGARTALARRPGPPPGEAHGEKAATFPRVPRVLNRNRDVIPPDAVWCGRPGPLGNPFLLGQDGTRDEVVDRHAAWVPTQPRLLPLIQSLRGKDLVCVCAPQRCHCDLYLRMANGPECAAVENAGEVQPQAPLEAGFSFSQDDIFATDADVIVNTVNCVGVMGKGIASGVKKRWPGCFKDYRRNCATGLIRPGAMSHYDTGERPVRFIVNFPTKRHWRDDSRMDDIRDGLAALATSLPFLDVRSVAIPPLGCGNGNLDWSVVRPLIMEALAPLAGRLRIVIHGSPG